MNLKEQAYVCAVADCGSVTDAARALKISQPALTSYIRGVERAIGAPLFDRVGKSFFLTPLGRAYVDAAREMLRLHDGFLFAAKQEQIWHSGEISIGIQDAMSTELYARVYPALRAKLPEISVKLFELRAAELRSKLAAGDIDLFVSVEQKNTQNIVYTAMRDFPVEFAVPADHPAARSNEPVDLRSFADETFFLPPHNYSIRRIVDEWFDGAGFSPSRTVLFHKAPTIMRLIAAGEGVGFFTRNSAELSSVARSVAVVKLDLPQRSVSCGVCALRGRYFPPFVDDVREIISRGLDSLASDDGA